MSFFDEYVDIGGGGLWLASEQKQVMIENGIVFQIKGLAIDEDNQYGPRYVAFCEIPNTETGDLEPGKIGFPIGSGADSRDAMLKAMSKYLESEDAQPVFVKLEKPGRAILLVAAEAPAK